MCLHLFGPPITKEDRQEKSKQTLDIRRLTHHRHLSRKEGPIFLKKATFILKNGTFMLYCQKKTCFCIKFVVFWRCRDRNSGTLLSLIRACVGIGKSVILSEITLPRCHSITICDGEHFWLDWNLFPSYYLTD